MPERIYQGSHDAVEIVVDGQTQRVEKGQPVTVGADQAKEMDASEAWGTPGSKSSKEQSS